MFPFTFREKVYEIAIWKMMGLLLDQCGKMSEKAK